MLLTSSGKSKTNRKRERKSLQKLWCWANGNGINGLLQQKSTMRERERDEPSAEPLIIKRQQ
jgi:hypothetical protein